jgi:plasmid stabilization system protein ParE
MDSSLEDMASIKKYLSQFYESTWPKTSIEIKGHIKHLEETPFAFPLYAGSKAYRKLVAGNYIVLYRIIEENHVVEIHAIWHGRMNIQKHIKYLPAD